MLFAYFLVPASSLYYICSPDDEPEFTIALFNLKFEFVNAEVIP